MIEQEGITNERDFIYIALSVLASQNDDTFIPELLFLVSPEQAMNLMRAFGGERLYVPTPKEFSRDLMAAVVAYHQKSEQVWRCPDSETDGHRRTNIESFEHKNLQVGRVDETKRSKREREYSRHDFCCSATSEWYSQSSGLRV